MERLDFLSYRWPLFAVSTVVFIIGFTSHLLVFIFTNQCSKKDNRAYMVLIKAYSAMSVIGSLAGYLGGLRSEAIFPYFVYVPYGPARYILQPRIINIMDSLCTQLVPIAPMLLAIMMVFRALIMFNKRLKKSAVYAVLGLVFFSTFPLNLWFVKNYVPLKEVPFVNVSQALLHEFRIAPSYAVLIDETADLFWNISNYIPLVSIGIGFVTLLLMIWKLHSIRKIIGKTTRKLHAAFMMLLALDLIIIVFYSIVISVALTGISQITADFIGMFTYPIFVLPLVIQGIMSLLFVPYLRASFIAMIRGKRVGSAQNSHRQITITAIKSSS